MSIWSKFTGKDMRAKAEALLMGAESKTRLVADNLTSSRQLLDERKALLEAAKNVQQETANKSLAVESAKVAAENDAEAASIQRDVARAAREEAEAELQEAILLKTVTAGLKLEAADYLEKVRQVWVKASEDAQAHAMFAVSAIHMQGVRDVMDKLRPVQGEPRAVDSFRPCSLGHRMPTLTKENVVRCATCGQKVDQA